MPTVWPTVHEMANGDLPNLKYVSDAWGHVAEKNILTPHHQENINLRCAVDDRKQQTMYLEKIPICKVMNTKVTIDEFPKILKYF